MTHPVLLSAVLFSFSLAAALEAQGAPRFRNPAGLSQPRGYSQTVEVPATARLVFVAGQVPLDSAGNLVGAGDIRAQTTRVFDNLRIALAASGATMNDVIKLNYYLVDVADLPAVREVRDRFVDSTHPPISTLAVVKGLYRDGVMLEVEAVAAPGAP